MFDSGSLVDPEEHWFLPVAWTVVGFQGSTGCLLDNVVVIRTGLTHRRLKADCYLLPLLFFLFLFSHEKVQLSRGQGNPYHHPPAISATQLQPSSSTSPPSLS